MALTITSHPDDICSPYRPAKFRFTTDVTMHPELCIKILIFCRNSSAQEWQLSSVCKAQLMPGQTYYEVDVSGNLQAWLKFDRLAYGTNLAINTPCSDSIVYYKIEAYEMYYDAFGVMTEYDDALSDDYIAVNAVLNSTEADLSDYIIPETNPESVATKFLTESPANQKIILNEQAELHFLCEAASIELFANIRYFDAANQLLYENNTTGVTITANRGILVFKAIDPGEEVTWDNVDRIQVWLYDDENDTSAAVTEVKTFKVDHKPHCDIIRAGWLNRLGGIEYYTFFGSQKKDFAVEKTKYRIPGRYELRSTANDTGRGTATVFSEGQTEMEVHSDFLDSTTMQWLMGILLSPEVWMLVGTDMIPIDVSTKKHTYQDDKVVQMKLQFTLANPVLSQNG